MWNMWNPKPDDFNILYVGRNIQRKNIPFMFETIAEFKKRGYETDRRIKFLMHMPFHDNGWNMDELIRQFDAYEWVLVNPSVSPGVGPEDRELNEIYNLADVHLHMSAAEGYDIPNLESLSAGVITTAMDYSAPPSWGGDVLQLIDPIIIRQEPMTNLGRAYPDVGHAAEVLNRIYCMPMEEKTKLWAKGRILAEKLSWNKFRDNWVNLIDRVEIPNNE